VHPPHHDLRPATSSSKPEKPAIIPFPESQQASRASDNDGDVSSLSMPSQASPLRSRVNSVPDAPNEQSARTPTRAQPPSAGPYRTSFGALSQLPPNSFNNLSPSPLRKSFSQGHSRALSSSSSANSMITPPMLSPPSHRTAFGHSTSRSISITGMPSSSSQNTNLSPPEVVNAGQLPNGSPPTTRRHHQRIHSRNLSIYFPRPGSIPVSSIAEDGDANGQDVSIPAVSLNDTLPSQGILLQDPPGHRRLGEGFSFGGRPERTISGSSSDSNEQSTMPQASRPKRRGHHHKHSLSHNFFSFLEPGQHLQPPVSASPESAWTPTTGLSSAGPTTTTFAQSQNESGTAVGLTSPNPDPLTSRPHSLPKDTVALSILQFVLGAALWVSGQQNGSLACTGLGYWVVFDSFGVALRHVLPVYLSMERTQAKTRRSYG
jgi:hypothetical protein